MDPRTLGAGGPPVSPIGLGTVKLGRNTQVKYPTTFDLPDDATVATLLQAARTLGVTLLDTAPAYGTSEQRLAPFLAAHRDDIVLVSKAGETYTDTDGSTYDFAPDAIRASTERSLERMGVSHLDVLLLHAGADDLAVLRTPGLRDALARIKSEGLATQVGLSGKTDAALREAADTGLDVVMTGFSLADPSRAEVLADIHARGVGVLAIKGLASGHLVAGDRPVTPAEAIRYVLDQPFVDCLVVGTLKTAHLEAAVAAACGPDPKGIP